MNKILIFQVCNGLWHVSLLHSWHWTRLARRIWTVQIHWALSCNSRQTKTTVVNLRRSSCAWLFLWLLVWNGRVICRANGKGKFAETLAEIQSRYCILWPCPQLRKDMPCLSGKDNNQICNQILFFLISTNLYVWQVQNLSYGVFFFVL